MATTGQLNDFQNSFISWLCRVEHDMNDFMSGYDTSPYRLASSLATLNGVAERGAEILPDIEIKLRDRLADIRTKAAMLEASGNDLEERPF